MQEKTALERLREKGCSGEDWKLVHMSRIVRLALDAKEKNRESRERRM